MRYRISLTAILILVGVPTARAVTLDSPLLGNGTGTQLTCRVVNVGTKDAMVTARLLNTNGTNIATSTFPACNAAIPLVPHQSCTVSLNGSIFARCNVTSTSSKIRATLATESGGIAQVVVPVTK